MKLMVGSMLVFGALFDMLLNRGAICAAVLGHVASFAHGVADACSHWLPTLGS